MIQQLIRAPYFELVNLIIGSLIFQPYGNTLQINKSKAII